MKPKPFAPRTKSWAMRHRESIPGLLALGFDPGWSKDELYFRLSHADEWHWRDEIWYPTSRMKLLGGNTKMGKSLKEVNYLTLGLSLSPDLESGIQMCPGSGQCASVCLAKTGQYTGAEHQRVRIKKTLYLNLFPDDFIRHLVNDMKVLVGKAYRKSTPGRIIKAAVRLNVLSDVAWERVPEIVTMIEAGDLSVYDYTKVAWKARQPRPDGYSLTYSLSERRGSLNRAEAWMDRGGNAAVVVGPAFTPELTAAVNDLNERMQLYLLAGGEPWDKAYDSMRGKRSDLVEPGQHSAAAKARAAVLLARNNLWGRKLVDGDKHDARFDDPGGRWVVLYAKGDSAYDTSGFVVRIRKDGTPVDATPAARRARERGAAVSREAASEFRLLLSPAARMACDPVWTDPSTMRLVPGPDSLLRLSPKERADLKKAKGKRKRAKEKKARKKGRGRGYRAPAARLSCFTIPVPWGVDPWGNPLPGGLI